METLLGMTGELVELGTLIRCETEKEMEAIVANLTGRLGFAYFLYVGQFSLDRAKNLERILSNFPAPWLHQPQPGRWPGLDGVAEHAHRSLTPKAWRGQVQEATVATGISFPVHHKDGAVGTLSLVADDAAGDNRWLYGATIANYLHEAMLQMVRKNAQLIKAPLTPRERECLRWIAEGKSTWEIAKILGISEHGVQHHVRNTMDKFDVTSRHKAVARAMAYGVI